MPQLIDRIEKQKENQLIKKSFSDIINGYSVIDTKEFGVLYIKHLNNFDISEIETQKLLFYNEAVKNGVLTYEENRKKCIEDGLWSENEDIKIRDLTSYISNMEVTRSKLSIQTERNAVLKKIKETKKEVEDLSRKRDSIIKDNAETFSNKRTNEFYLSFSLYKNGQMSERKFSDEEFDGLSNDDIYFLTKYYNDEIEKFQENFLKKIAISRGFFSYFSLCNNDPMVFYGQPVTKLTFYQVELFSHGKFFKDALTNIDNKPPVQLYDDPEALIEWIESSVNMKQSIKNRNMKVQDAAAVSIPGASMDDLRKAEDGNTEYVNLSKEAKKHGGKMNMEQIMKTHGIKFK